MSPATPSPIVRPMASQYLRHVDHIASDTGTFTA